MNRPPFFVRALNKGGNRSPPNRALLQITEGENAAYITMLRRSFLAYKIYCLIREIFKFGITRQTNPREQVRR